MKEFAREGTSATLTTNRPNERRTGKTSGGMAELTLAASVKPIDGFLPVPSADARSRAISTAV